MSIQKITRTEAETLGVSSLPNRPSAPSLYSGEALTAKELRAAFDRLPLLVAERLNALIDALGLYTEGQEKETLAALIATDLFDENPFHSLADLFADIKNGAFADYLTVDEERTLTEVLSAMQDAISLPDDVSDLRAYIDNPKGEVKEGSLLPVSGETVFEHTSALETRLSSRIPSVSGEVKAGETRPVAGDTVFKALSTGVASLDARLSTVESTVEGMPFHFDTLSSEEGRMAVPDGAMRYAQLESLGGCTRASKNLFRLEPNTDYGSVQVETDREYDGGYTTTRIICSTDENGYLSICTDGYKISGGASIALRSPAFPRSENGENRNVTLSARYISGLVTPSDMGECCLMLGDNQIALPTSENPLVTQVGVAASAIDSIMPMYCCLSGDYKIALQIEEGMTATEYAPCWATRSAKLTAIKSKGKNLLDIASGVNECLTNNGDGTYTLTKTSANRFSATIACNIPKGATIALHANVLNNTSMYSGMQIQLLNGSSEVAASILSQDLRTITLSESVNSVRFYIASESAVGDFVTICEPQIEYGSAKTEYVPYVDAVDTYVIPQEIRSLDGYGLGASDDCRNLIDFERMAYHKKAASVDLGTLDWQSSSSRFVASLPIAGKATLSHQKPAKAICPAYNTLSQEEIEANNVGIAIEPMTATTVSFYNPLFKNATEVKNALSGVNLVYETAEPVMIDIMEQIPITPYIKVEQGGYLEAVSEDGTPAALTATYQIEN